MLQLVAGEQIEVTFGARLGLSTLAAAALGNLVSDVCGVGVASHIEVREVLRHAPSHPDISHQQSVC